MNILMLVYRFHPHLGGVEKHLYEVCNELLHRGHAIHVLTERHQNGLADSEHVELPNGALRVTRMESRGRFHYLNLLRHKALIRDADVVHCHDFATFLYWYLPFRFFFPGKPVYITFHGWEGTFPVSKLTVYLRKLVERLTLGNMCAGEFICKWYGTETDHVTYGGVRLDAEDGDRGGEAASGAVFVGRVGRDTGLDIYLKALGILKESGLELPLTVCGDGPLMAECRALADSLNLEVDFRGWVSEPNEYIRRARFVFVSGYLAILQAMAMGKLVFSVYDNPLKEDYLKLLPNNERTMFIAGGPDTLVEQLRLCFADKAEADAKIGEARSWALQQTWDKVADVYEQLWKCS